MFLTLLVHLQERRYIRRLSQFVCAGTSGLDVVITTPRHIQISIYSIYNDAPDDGITKSETCRAPHENKD